METATNNSAKPRSANAVRLARFYRRRALGRAVLSAEVDYDALRDKLIQRGHLNEFEAEDREAVQRAYQTWLTEELKYR